MSWRPLRFPDMDERSKEEDSSLRASRSTLLSSFNAGDSSKLILVNIFENYTSHRVIELKQIIDSNKKKKLRFCCFDSFINRECIGVIVKESMTYSGTAAASCRRASDQRCSRCGAEFGDCIRHSLCRSRVS